MITPENLKYYFDQLKENDIKEAFKSDGDTIACYMSGYGHCYIESFNYSENNEEDIISTGGLITDKDNVLILFNESKSENEYLKELIR